MTSENQEPKRKLIEVALPLEVINRESAREKSIRHGHPSTLHLWWARRPLAAARAVLFAQLVDDPSSRLEEFPTEELQRKERERLHKLIERLVLWDNVRDERLLAEAREEILKSTNRNPPPILDPFAGGGSIPLEAQRLGLEVYASDLNPVAVLINKALIEIPPKFVGRTPVSPSVARDQLAHPWPGATGLAEDVSRYGHWIRDEARRRIGHLYPKATLPDGTQATVVAWIWTRTVTCPNPACSIAMPLVRSWWLGKKKGREAYVVPSVVDGRVRFTIGHDLKHAPTEDTDGTVGRTGATCINCNASVELKYIRVEGQKGRLGAQLMSIVGEGSRSRLYLEPSAEQVLAAEIPMPDGVPSGDLPDNPRDFKTPNYGMRSFADLFTARQLTALTTFSDLVSEAREQVLADARASGMSDGERLEAEGTDAVAYADAVATYLGFSVSKALARNNTMCGWESGMDRLRGSFQRQAIPMTWDYAEANPLTGSGGGLTAVIQSEVEVLEALVRGRGGQATQADAANRPYSGMLISTDPPFRKLSACYGSVCCCGTTPQRSGLAPLLRTAA